MPTPPDRTTIHQFDLKRPYGDGTCQHCGKRPATVKWVGEGGTLAEVHGFFQMWCEVCMFEAQLAYAKAQAEKIPDLEAQLAKARLSGEP